MVEDGTDCIRQCDGNAKGTDCDESGEEEEDEGRDGVAVGVGA